MARRWSGSARLAIIALAAVAAYAPALRAGFVFDDHALVETSALLDGPLWRLWASAAAPDYWPLTWTTFWIERRLLGTAAWGYHAVNVGLHAGVSVLLWRALRRLRVPGGWLAALLFAVHPVAVESVAWISERKNVLSACLFLGTALAWLRFDEERRGRDGALAILLFVLACLAKGSVVMLPVVLGGIALRRRGRLERRDLVALAPLLAIALVMGLVNVWFQRHNAMGLGGGPARGLAERVGGAGWALAFYLRTAFLPASLGFVHAPWPVSPGSPMFQAPLVALVLGFALLVLARDRYAWARPARDAVAYHAVMVLPVLGLLDMAYLRVGPASNHLQYLALMGPVALLGAGAAALASRSRLARPTAAAAALAFGVATYGRAAELHDDGTLWEAAVRDAPDSAFAHYQWGILLGQGGRLLASQRELEAAARAASDPAVRHVYRAFWMRSAGRRAEAVAEARSALAVSADPEIRRDAAWLLLQAGESAEARVVLADLAKAAPHSSDYAYWLANALWRERQEQAAVDVLQAFCRDHPGNREMEKALGLVLVKAGRWDEARRHAAGVAGVGVGDPRAEALLSQWGDRSPR